MQQTISSNSVPNECVQSESTLALGTTMVDFPDNATENFRNTAAPNIRAVNSLNYIVDRPPFVSRQLSSLSSHLQGRRFPQTRSDSFSDQSYEEESISQGESDIECEESQNGGKGTESLATRQSEMRKQIMLIQSNPNISAPEKAKRIQVYTLSITL